MQTLSPFFNRSTAGCSASMAFAVFPRSMNAISAMRMNVLKPGVFSASFFATRLKSQPGPRIFLRAILQESLRIDGGRMAYGAQKFDVLIAVGVSITSLQSNLVLSGELAHRSRLAGAPERVPYDASGQPAFAHHGLGAQQLVDAQLRCGGQDLIPGGRGGDHNRVPHLLMSLHQAPGFGEHSRRSP